MKRLIALLLAVTTAFGQSFPVKTNASGVLTEPATFISANTLVTTATLAAGYQPLDADLTAIAAVVTTANGRSLLTATALTAAGLGLTNGANIDLWGAKALPSGIVVGTTDTQTLTGKTLSLASNTLTATSAQLAAATSDETGTGALVFGTSPTLSAPVIGSIVNTGTLTLPTATDTLVGRATTDTLTNKSISGASNTLTAIPNAALGNSTLTLGSSTLTLGSTTTTVAGLTLTSPTLTTPALGTPASGVLTNATGTAAGLTAGNVTTNANLTGDVTSLGNAATLATVATAGTTGGSTAIPVVTINAKGLTTSITTAAVVAPAGTLTGATLASGVTASSLTTVGTLQSPVMVTPALGTPVSGVLTNATGLPLATGISGLGTGIATSLAVAVGSAGAPVINGGVLGTPASGVGTNLTALNATQLTTGTVPDARFPATLPALSGVNLTALNASSLASGTVSAARMPALTGDLTTTAGAVATTLATVNANVGTFGSATAAPVVTLNAKGLVTAGSTVTITPAVGSITGLGTGVATFAATPSSANLAAALTDETGTGPLVFATSPTLTTPISATLTSPAATPLTLGTTDSGAAITVLSASNNVGVGVIAPAAKLEIAGTYADEGSERTPATVQKLSVITGGGGDGATYFKTGWSNSANSGIFTVGVGYYSGGSQVRDVITLRGSTGDVSIPSTTAASANAGALVLQGGISAGNTGSASYFGGSVQIANAIISQSGNNAFITGPTTAGAFLTLQSGNATGGINFRDSAGNQVGQYYQVTDAWSFAKPTTFAGAVTVSGAGSTDYGSTNPTLILNRANSAAGNFVRFQGTAAYDTYIGTIGTAAGIAPTADTFVIGSTVAGLPTFALVPSTGAATFAGTVTAAADATINGLTVGRGAGAVSTNTAVGANAISGSNTGGNNTAVGWETLKVNTSGAQNVAIGRSALAANNTGSGNNAMGVGALSANQSGSNNIAIGGDALVANLSASENTAVGYRALYSNTTGGQNTALGDNALSSNTTASYNTALGRYAAQLNTTGTGLTAVGHQALASNTTGTANIAMGGYDSTSGNYAALYENTTGSFNVGIGVAALRSNTTASNNTAVGNTAGYFTTGASNTFLGSSAGYAVTTGAKNTIIGAYNGNQGSLDIRTASNYIVLSDGDGNPRAYFNGSAATFAGTVTVANGIVSTDNAGTGLSAHFTGPGSTGIRLTKTTGTAQTFQITTAADFVVEDVTASTVPFRITGATGAATFAGAGAFGGAGSLGSTYLSRLSVFTAGAGNFSVGGQTNTNNTVVARMTAYNASNGNSGNEASPAFMGIASIESVVKTATGNAGGDSGGDLVFLTKGDGGTLTERMRLLSTGAATFAGAVTAAGTITGSGGGGLVLNGTPVIYFGNPSANYLYYDGTSLITRLGSVDRLTISATTGAATFAGTLTTSSGRVVATSIKTSAYTLATTDHVIVCNSASTPFTVTLIAASANTGRVFVVKNKGAATVTLSATSLGTIDGSNTRDLSTNQSLTLCSDGVQWNII